MARSLKCIGATTLESISEIDFQIDIREKSEFLGLIQTKKINANLVGGLAIDNHNSIKN